MSEFTSLGYENMACVGKWPCGATKRLKNNCAKSCDAFDMKLTVKGTFEVYLGES